MTAVVLPFGIPSDMNENDRSFLLEELRKLSSDYAALSALDGERHKVINARLAKMELASEYRARAEIEARDRVATAWRQRVWSVFAVLATSALFSLITHWLATK